MEKEPERSEILSLTIACRNTQGKYANRRMQAPVAKKTKTFAQKMDMETGRPLLLLLLPNNTTEIDTVCCASE